MIDLRVMDIRARFRHAQIALMLLRTQRMLRELE